MATQPAVDIHAHFFPEAFLRLIESEGAAHGLSLRTSAEGPTIMIGQVPIGPIARGYYDLNARLRDMDRQRVALPALSLTAPMTYWADGDLGVRAARVVNDAMADAARRHPDRFVGLATLPMRTPEAAVAEVSRAVTELGLRGVYLGTNVRAAALDDPPFTRGFERSAALACPVLLPPVTVPGARRSAPTFPPTLPA